MESVRNARAWWVFVIASLGIPYQFYLQCTPGVMVSGLNEAFGVNSTQIGVLSSCFFYTYLVLQIPAGLVVDRIGPHRSLIIGMSGCILGCIYFAVATHYASLIAARLFMGLSASFFVPAAMVTAQGWHPACRFALLAGMAESIGMAGGGLGEQAVGRGVLLIGWRASMWVSALVGLLILILVAFVVKDRCSHSARKELGSFWDQLAALCSAFSAVVKIRQLWLIALFAALTFGMLAAFAGLWVVPYLQLRFSLPVDRAAFLGSVIYLGVAICAPLCGAYYARTCRKKKMLRSLAFLAGLLFTALLFMPMREAMLAPVMLLLGAFSSVYVLSFGLIPEVVPDRLRGAGAGLVNMGSMLIGAPILQPTIGWWLHVGKQTPQAILTHYQQSFFALAVGLFLAVALVSWLPVAQRETKKDSLLQA